VDAVHVKIAPATLAIFVDGGIRRQTKRDRQTGTPCRFRSREVANPPLDLTCTGLWRSQRAFHLLLGIAIADRHRRGQKKPGIP